MRHEHNAPGVVFTRLIDEPLIVLMPAGHRLTAQGCDHAGGHRRRATVGVPHDKSPALRAVTDAYGAKLGIDLTPDHYVDNLSMAMSLVASTGGIALMPLYARNLLPPTVISRPLAGVAPMIDLSLGYNEANRSPILKAIVARIGELKFRRMIPVTHRSRRRSMRCRCSGSSGSRPWKMDIRTRFLVQHKGRLLQITPS